MFQAGGNMNSHRTWGFAVSALLLFATVSPARAESRIEKNLALAPGGQLDLESDVGSVSVTGTSRSGAHIVVTSVRDDLTSEYDLSFSSSAGSARVTARRKHELWWPHGSSVHFEIEVPTETRTELRTGGGAIDISGLQGPANIKTSGGPIEVNGLNGSLEAYTSGGPIHIREVTGNAHLSTSGGPIHVEALEGNLNAHTSGGGIHVDRVSGSVEARTSGGPIRVVESHGNRHGGVLDTSGGSIEVTIDPTANLNVDASTSGGSVSSDVPVQAVGTARHSSLRGAIGSGGETLVLHTSGGSIRIHAL
jgi:DUF4097 and DUF4098 domain-containing protein YvlB